MADDSATKALFQSQMQMKDIVLSFFAGIGIALLLSTLIVDADRMDDNRACPFRKRTRPCKPMNIKPKKIVDTVNKAVTKALKAPADNDATGPVGEEMTMVGEEMTQVGEELGPVSTPSTLGSRIGGRLGGAALKPYKSFRQPGRYPGAEVSSWAGPAMKAKFVKKEAAAPKSKSAPLPSAPTSAPKSAIPVAKTATTTKALKNTLEDPSNYEVTQRNGNIILPR